MTVAERQNPEHARGDDEFLAFPSNEDGPTELGIIVHRDGRVTNRWGDGSVGVNQEWYTLAADEEALVNFGGDADGGWYDVLVDTQGNFVDWGD